jgi:O-antigen/teichoic acid export membrane protein
MGLGPRPVLAPPLPPGQLGSPTVHVRFPHRCRTREPSVSQTRRSDGQGAGLVRHGLTYSPAPLFKNAVSFGMTRFYTFTLPTVALWGVKEMVDLWMLLLQHLLGQSLLMAVLRVYYDQKDEAQRAAVVTSTTIALGLTAALVCGSMLLWTDALWPVLIGQPAPGASAFEIRSAFVYLMLLVPFQLTTGSGFYYLQTTKRSALYSKLQTAKLVFEVGLHLYLMGVLDLELRGFLLGLLIGEVTASVTITGWMLVHLRPRFRWSAFRAVLAYGAPLVPVGVFQLGLHSLDRRLIEAVYSGAQGLDLAGIYGLGYKVGMMANVICTAPFLQIWQPTIFAVEDEAERTRLVRRVTTWLVVAIGAVTLGLICGGRQVIDLIAGKEDYLLAREVVPWVAIGYALWALYNSAQIPLFLAKRTLPLVLINALALALSIALNLLLIPLWGNTGAAVTTLISFAFLAGAVMLLAHRQFGVRFELARLSKAFAILVACAFVARWLDEFEPYSGAARFAWVLGAKSLLLVGGLAGLWWGVLAADERGGVISRLRSLLGRPTPSGS